MPHSFAAMDARLVQTFGYAVSFSSEFTGPVSVVAVPVTGESAAALFPSSFAALFLQLSSFSERPRVGDQFEVPAGLPGIPEGFYRINGTSEVDPAGGFYVGIALIRQ